MTVKQKSSNSKRIQILYALIIVLLLIVLSCIACLIVKLCGQKLSPVQKATSHIIPRLVRSGNTCYFNSLVQCLNCFHAPLILASSNSKPLFKELKAIFSAMENKENDFTANYKRIFEILGSSYSTSDMNDPAEVFLQVFDKLETEMSADEKDRFKAELKISGYVSQPHEKWLVEVGVPAEPLDTDTLKLTEILHPGANFANVVPIALPRISFDGTGKKLKYTLEFPNVLAYGDKEYELYAVIYHEGDYATSGHYYAKVKHNDVWYMADDTDIHVTEMKFESKNCSVLFYRLKA